MRILAVCNPKGGVGKTTTAINLGTALACDDQKVLIVDLDPRGNASTGLGVSEDTRSPSVRDVLKGTCSIGDAAQQTLVRNLEIVPAYFDLVDAEFGHGPFRLRNVLQELVAKQHARPAEVPYTYLLIDCPPAQGRLNLNAIVAAHAVLIPVQCEFFALEGISQLKDTIDQIKATLNPGLEIQGVVLTMHDARTSLSKEVATEVRAFFGPKVYETMIPRNERVAAAPSFGKPILLYEYEGPGSQAYIRLAREFLRRDATQQTIRG